VTQDEGPNAQKSPLPVEVVRDLTYAGRDIVNQYLTQSWDDAALGRLSVSRGAELMAGLAETAETIERAARRARASWSRSSCWNCSGVIVVSARKCRWKDVTLIVASAARSAVRSGWS
jgi:hypothetical protein